MPATLIQLIEQPGHSKSANNDGTISYSIKYFAKFSEAVTNAFEADALAGFSKGQALSFATALTLQSWTTKETDSPEIWEFDCNYQSVTYDGASPSDSIEIETFSWSETREIIAINTVGDPMFPPIQDQEYWPGIRIIWNDASLDMSDYNIGGAVNNTQLTVAGITVPPYCMKAGALDFRKVTDGITTSWQKVLPLYFCFKKASSAGASHVVGDVIGFQKEIINNGFRIYAGGGGPGDYLVNIVDEEGEDITQPQRLNAAGTSLLAPSDPSFSFLVLPAELDDFSAFNLPTSAPS
jgi:hypothetical protein